MHGISKGVDRAAVYVNLRQPMKLNRGVQQVDPNEKLRHVDAMFPLVSPVTLRHALSKSNFVVAADDLASRPSSATFRRFWRLWAVWNFHENSRVPSVYILRFMWKWSVQFLHPSISVQVGIYMNLHMMGELRARSRPRDNRMSEMS